MNCKIPYCSDWLSCWCGQKISFNNELLGFDCCESVSVCVCVHVKITVEIVNSNHSEIGIDTVLSYIRTKPCTTIVCNTPKLTHTKSQCYFKQKRRCVTFSQQSTEFNFWIQMKSVPNVKFGRLHVVLRCYQSIGDVGCHLFLKKRDQQICCWSQFPK